MATDVDSAKMHMEEAANLISSIQQTLTEIDAVVGSVNERSKRTILHIETAAQRLVQTITEHRHKLVSKVCEITEAKLQALQAEKESVQYHFGIVENVLRCAQNTRAVEDSAEWENALSRQSTNLRGQVFDVQEYNEDLKFHFLYRDDNLLSAICKFGDVFTIANDEQHPKTGDHEAVACQTETEVWKDDVEEIMLTDNVEREPMLMQFEENLSNSDQETATETKFAGASTRLFEETVDVTRLKEETKDCNELNKEGTSEDKRQGQKEEETRDISNNNEDVTLEDLTHKERSGLTEVPDATDEVYSGFHVERAKRSIIEEQNLGVRNDVNMQHC